MASQFGIDLGEAYRNIESIKNSRTARRNSNLAAEGMKTNNALSAMKLSDAQRIEQERPGKEAAAKNRNSAIVEARTGAANGNQNAAKQLLILDPKNGQEFLSAISEMDKNQLEATKRRIDETGKTLATLLNMKNQDKAAELYSRIYASAPPKQKAGMEPEYNPENIQLQLSKAMTMEQILENPTIKEFGGDQVMMKNGRVIEKTKTPVDDKSGGGGGLKSADESLMFKQAVSLMGGLFDQNGNITNLDKNVRNTVQGIAEAASRIYANGNGSVTRSESVAKAGREYGYNVKTAKELKEAIAKGEKPKSDETPEQKRERLLNKYSSQ